MTAGALRLSLALEYEAAIEARWKQALPRAAFLVNRAVRATLLFAAEKRGRPLFPAKRITLSILLTDSLRQRRLNHRFRHKNSTTNILAFPAGVETPQFFHLGDLSLAYEVLKREALSQGKRLSDHFTHLLVHGILHLLGFDHKAAASARKMEAMERAILARMGIEDPYRWENGPHA